MTGRLLVLAALVSATAVGVAWVSLQPLLARAVTLGPDRVQRLGALLLGLDFALVTLTAFGLLYFAIGRQLHRLRASVVELAGSTEGDGGGLLVRLDTALRRLARELADERGRAAAQLAELRASHEQLLRLQAELVANDRLATVGKLAAGVAHEVGNPLAGILGYLSLVRRHSEKEPALADLVTRIEAEVQRIDQIVRALLELGRPSRGRAAPLDVRPVVESAVRLLGAGKDLAGVRVDIVGPASLWLRAESGPLSQVLVNLLLNAAQAMGGAGAIEVRLEPGDGEGKVHVDDHGPGLPETVRARLFEPFFTTKAPGVGTGLGLAVSRHLLAQFEGRLEAGSAPGGGARFTITLPAP
jgi:C4-dicarboxylate-specific signal transduction histidine kinase